MAHDIPIRTVKVELLRTGPSHNQLLSPLTTYIGICDGAEAGVVNVPFEHEAFMRRVAALRDKNFDLAAQGPVLRDMGIDIARLLAAVPRLPGALGASATGDTLVHLQLVLSAAELALLPFEMAKVPVGTTAWAENWLSLQVGTPVVITRRTREVGTPAATWPRCPRVLFVAGDPDEDAVPFDEHRQALVDALAPYFTRWQATPSSSGNREEFDGVLTVLKNASFDDVVKECAARPYTHIHLLTHGVPDRNSNGQSYGMLLHPSAGSDEVISGERLASAFATLVDGRLHRPSVVTLAICDGGNVDTVQRPAASLAHELHRAGIPLVVASQFPLSMAGSKLLVNDLYPGLLAGAHPLPLLHRIRTDLHSRLSTQSNDWASLVVYEALPPDLARQLDEVRFEQCRLVLENAFNQLDDTMRAHQNQLPQAQYAALASRVVQLADALPLDSRFHAECLGLRAGSRKRLAELAFYACVATQATGEAAADDSVSDTANGYRYQCFSHLEDALNDYQDASTGFLCNEAGGLRPASSLHWVLGQQLSLAAVLGADVADGAWDTARVCAEAYLERNDSDDRQWAHGTLAELWLLKLVPANGQPLHAAQAQAAATNARHHASELIRLARSRDDSQVLATHKQFVRYAHWWCRSDFEQAAHDWPGQRSARDASWATLGVQALAGQLIDILDQRGPGKRAAWPDAARPVAMSDADTATANAAATADATTATVPQE